MAKQQSILDSFFDELIAGVGTELGNRIYDNVSIDDQTLPLAVYTVITDEDERLLGDERLTNTNIQVSFIGKKSKGVSTIRGISDTFVEYIDGRRLSNDMVVKVVLKGISLISDVNDPNIQIITEFNIRE
jgi:hypothetical protein